MLDHSLLTLSVKKEKIFGLRVLVRGAVQGVGFRPFIYRLANDVHVNGWVNNSPQGVTVEIEGSRQQLESFISRLRTEKPARASIENIESFPLDAVGYREFVIRGSKESKTKTATVLPDIATCPDCLKEIFDTANRRYLYPFTNCTNCGPRFSIITSIPYDRANTTMKKFRMCPQCQAEYEDPGNRRFHAQPNACPACGPHLELWDGKGKKLFTGHEALLKAVSAVCEGKIVALKGLGGFQFIVDAQNQKAVARLRQRKHREEKPFALMFPDLRIIKQHCDVSKMEGALLASPEAPIVLLRRTAAAKGALAPSVAPNNPYLGVMLPYTPLHHIFMKEMNAPVVATSGNLSDEPICTDEKEALARLSGIADVFLVHNRPIARHMDDSVVRMAAGRMLSLRRARGFAPLPIPVSQDVSNILAAGAHLKNTVALGVGKNVFVSQHLGDLKTVQSSRAFRQSLKDLPRLYASKIEHIACDRHPDYLSTTYARRSKLPVVAVQHHHAHIVSCMSENGIAEEVLGVSWDGAGFGLDGTIWGGEFLMSTLADFKRIGYFRTFRLPGGELAIKEPRRVALGVLYEIFGEKVFAMRSLACIRTFSDKELRVMAKMLNSPLNSPLTSSAGRLFDAVSSLLGLYQKTSFEGQAAMGLEYLLEKAQTFEHYPFTIDSSAVCAIDWAPMFKEILSDIKKVIPKSEISAKFHNTLAEIIVAVAKRRENKDVALSGGCFQNKYLTERTIARLRQEGFNPIWHKDIPPNDGGISLGQIVVASENLKRLSGNPDIRD